MEFRTGAEGNLINLYASPSPPRPRWIRNRNEVFWTLWTLFAAIILSGCNGEIRDFDITQYEKSKVVGILSQEKGRDKIGITTSAGVHVTVFLPSINSVSLRFQDENKDRQIYHAYFIYSAETRHLKGKDLLFVKIAGAHIDRLNEWYKEEKIFVYNVTTRKLIGWVKI